MIAKPERHRSPAHLRWVATQPCCVCHHGRPADRARMVGDVISQAHHVTTAHPDAVMVEWARDEMGSFW